MSRTIRASVGEAEYLSAVITETTGKTITGDTFTLSLGTYDAPATWTPPDVTQTITASSVRLKLLVGAGGTVNPTANTYWLWVRVADAPETNVLRIDERITIA